MPEADAIAISKRPVTRDSLVSDLSRLGVGPGQNVLVHSSLSSLGWVCGGAVTVVEALIEVLGPQGTLVMPSFTFDLSEPSNWRRPPVPPDWYEAIRASAPAFDARTTPTRGMGAIAELFRSWPDVVRSNHPTSSICARGPLASALITPHPFDDPVGESSPIGRLYESAAKVLLLGVGHRRNTSLHLAERKAFGARQSRIRTGSPILQDGRRRWIEYDEPDLDSDDFEAIGEDFESVPSRAVRGQVGFGVGILLDQRTIVDFAVGWLTRRRTLDGLTAEKCDSMRPRI